MSMFKCYQSLPISSFFVDALRVFITLMSTKQTFVLIYTALCTLRRCEYRKARVTITLIGTNGIVANSTITLM